MGVNKVARFESPTKPDYLTGWVGLKICQPDMIGLGWVEWANLSNPSRAQPYIGQCRSLEEERFENQRKWGQNERRDDEGQKGPEGGGSVLERKGERSKLWC